MYSYNSCVTKFLSLFTVLEPQISFRARRLSLKIKLSITCDLLQLCNPYLLCTQITKKYSARCSAQRVSSAGRAIAAIGSLASRCRARIDCDIIFEPSAYRRMSKLYFMVQWREKSIFQKIGTLRKKQTTPAIKAPKSLKANIN